MAESLGFAAAYAVYVVTLLLFVLLSFRSRNDVVTMWGLIYGLYSLGFVAQGVSFEFFALWIDAEFTAQHYMMFTLLNLACTAVALLSNAPRPGPPQPPRLVKITGWAFLALGTIAALNELRYYGLYNFFLSDKVLRFSGALGTVTNLFVISIDYRLFLMAGCYALSTIAHGRTTRWLWYAGMAAAAVTGFLQGYRYYVALLFLLAYVDVVKHRLRLRPLVSVGIIVAVLPLAEATKDLLSWIRYYQWVRGYGFFNYIAMNIGSFLPGEIQAITVNTYLGLALYFDQLHADVLGYFAKAIPLSERFYDFTRLDDMYATIGQHMQFAPGTGTAFSFFLENYVAFFLPMLALLGVLVLTRVHRAPVVKVAAILFLLNLVRNGFLVAISALKIPLLFYVMVLGGVWAIGLLRPRRRAPPSLPAALPSGETARGGA